MLVVWDRVIRAEMVRIGKVLNAVRRKSLQNLLIVR